MKFAIAALLGLAAATESRYGGYGRYTTRRATWSPTTTVTSGNAWARYGERDAVVRCEDKDAGLPTECSWKQARLDQAKDCAPKCGYGGCGYSSCSYGSSCGVKGCSGSGYGARAVAPRRGLGKVRATTTAGYAGWEHPSMRLLRSLGKEPEVAGKAWGYAELTTTPCGDGYACGYGCLDKCEEPEEVVIEKREPRVISMWENPTRTPNVRLTNGLAGYTAGIMKVPGNPRIPGAAAVPVPERKVRERKTRPYREDGQPNHVVSTACDTCGTGTCGTCRPSGAPDDRAPSYHVPKYHSKRSTNYLW